jgi:hypothetical protein
MATPEEPARFDRVKFLQRFAGARKLDMYLERSYGPAHARQALRKLGVEKIVVTPDGDDGGVFAGLADIGYLLNGRLYTGLTPSSDHSHVRSDHRRAIPILSACFVGSRIGNGSPGRRPPPSRRVTVRCACLASRTMASARGRYLPP